MTNAQWHLALLACLIVLARLPETATGRWFDRAILILNGLTGPFCLVLLPISGLMLYWTRERSRMIPAVILAGTSALQAVALFFTGNASRSHLALGASFGSLSKLLAGQVYLATLVGHNTLALQLGSSSLSWIAGLGTVLFIWWLWLSPKEMRLFALFSGLILSASLANPELPQYLSPLESGLTSWRIMAGAPGVRYWFFPTLACTWMLVSFVAGPKRTNLTQIVGWGFLCLMLYGFVRDFRHPACKDLHFALYAEQFAHAKPGQTALIPENPNPEQWIIRLTKR